MKEVVIKTCPKHGNTEHALYDGRLRCKQCMVDYDREKRHRVKEKLVNYKGGKCEICGYDKCLNAFDFHHRNSEEKEFNLNSANYNRPLDVLYKEVDKCVLVCATCHREIHYELNEEKRKNIILNDYHRDRALSKLDLTNVLNDIENGLFQNDIAIKYDVSLSTVRRFYAKHKLNKKHFKYDTNEFLKLFDINPTYSDMSKQLNVTCKVLKKYCVDNNLIESMNEIRAKHGLKPLVDKLDYK